MLVNFETLDHERFMREALSEAEAAGQAGELPIGAVIAHDGQIVGRGRARHIDRYQGGGLEKESLALFEKYRPEEIGLLVKGKK